MVIMHIKLKELTYTATWYQIVCSKTHPRHQGGVKRSKHVFLKVVKLHIKLNGMEHRAPCKHILCHLPFGSWDWIKRSKHLFSKSSHVAYQIKGMEHRAPCKHIFCTYTLSRPLGAGSKGKTFLFERSHFAYQIIYSVLTHTIGPCGWIKISKHFFSESCHVA